MKKFNNQVKNLGHFIYRWVKPFFDSLHTLNSLPSFQGYFKDLKLVELSAIDDQNNFLENSSFACGLLHFTKK